MPKKNKLLYAVLFIIGLLVAGGAASFQHAPGYMDADYYYAGGYRLASGEGLTEPFLWNYLDNPAGVPHPSHAYWMPLASFLAAAGILFFGGDASLPLAAFPAGRFGFVLVAALLPPLTASLAFALSGRRSAAWLAGLLACFPAFYLPYLPTTDTFGIYMLLGVVWLRVAAGRWTMDKGSPRQAAVWAALLGFLAGLMHLARADGILWLVVSCAAVLFAPQLYAPHLFAPYPTGWRRAGRQIGIHLMFCLAGYLLVMGPWMARNWLTFGSLLSPGGLRSLWFTNYDELYTYPASLLTPARWWATGLGAILKARLWALNLNVQTGLIVQGQIFLTPLALAGMWRLRQSLAVKMGALAWLLTFFAMTVIFPFAGGRGGFFHSGAALQPLVWAAAPLGLEAFIGWGVRRRGWQSRPATLVFGSGLILLVVLITGMIAPRRIIGDSDKNNGWNASTTQYQQIEAALVELDAAPQDGVVVNDPPGFYVATGRWAVANPNGGADSQAAVAARYGARYLLLENNHPQFLEDLYTNPRDLTGLRFLRTVNGAHLFEFVSP